MWIFLSLTSVAIVAVVGWMYVRLSFFKAQYALLKDSKCIVDNIGCIGIQWKTFPSTFELRCAAHGSRPFQ